MHLQSTLMTTVLVLGNAALSTAFSFQAPLQCLQMKDKLEQIDTDTWVNNMVSTVCKRQCKPTLSDIQAHVFVPAIERSCIETDSTSLSGNYISLLDSMMKMAHEKCGVNKEENICGDTEKFKKACKCVQKNSWSLALSNTADFLPIVVENPCRKVKDYVSDQKRLDKMLNDVMEKYSSSC